MALDTEQTPATFDPALRRTRERESQARDLAQAFSRFEYVNVTFAAADQDVDIPHTLKPGYNEEVRYLVVRQSAPAGIYQDLGPTRRPWQRTHIFLRASIPTTARLLLVLESINADATDTTALAGILFP